MQALDARRRKVAFPRFGSNFTLMSSIGGSARVTALLGPTNTGKTYLAIERMLGHSTGMIGFPLRLLARENYDRVVKLVGARSVALITGEEKIIPAAARYFLCTVESMPVARPVEFLAVDEIQMAADAERGHVFTDRLLHARGIAETMFLGSETIRPLLSRLEPDTHFESRPRLSRLSYAGPKKLTRLPRRSAIVAFSANDVYSLAELLRRQRGGAAIVLGALSPRTRNAQVRMYQEGEVDYIVATDAIGMGLNMDVDHVAFSALHKFDGRYRRRLTAAEIGQIAGRAGRFMNDGTFGNVAELGPMDGEIVEAVEEHRFDPLTELQWRNADLDFRSPASLLRSLETMPRRQELRRARPSDDHLALSSLARDDDIRDAARHPEAVQLLWDVCQIPDFRKTLAEDHLRLLKDTYRHLTSPAAALPADWIADQLSRLDRADGDIDTLMARIAHVRTWTFITHRSDWVTDDSHWQARAREIEDRLSDALHEKLTQRFVDKRTAALDRLKGRSDLRAAVGANGDVTVEGEFVGHLYGFRFAPDTGAAGADRRALLTAANRVLRDEIGRRVEAMARAGDDAIDLDPEGRFVWQDAPVARLAAGLNPLAPEIQVTRSEHLDAPQREKLRRRLARWFDGHLRDVLSDLTRLRDPGPEIALTGPARGLAFQLAEALGVLRRREVSDLVAGLTADDRKALHRLKVRLGVETVHLGRILKPKAIALRALLWRIANDRTDCVPPDAGRITVPSDQSIPASFYHACGYHPAGGHAFRVDMLDRLAVWLMTTSKASEGGAPFPLTPDIQSQIGLGADDIAPAIKALGYTVASEETGLMIARRNQRSQRKRKKPTKKSSAGRKASKARRDKPPENADSPFARLRELGIGDR